MSLGSIPTFFGDRQTGFAGVIDFAEAGEGIRGWILRIDQPDRPVAWSLMAGDEEIVAGFADAVREDISLALGREAHCTLSIEWSRVAPEAVKRLSRLADNLPLRVVLSETGQEVPWSVERPTVSWLLLVLRSVAPAVAKRSEASSWDRRSGYDLEREESREAKGEAIAGGLSSLASLAEPKRPSVRVRRTMLEREPSGADKIAEASPSHVGGASRAWMGPTLEEWPLAVAPPVSGTTERAAEAQLAADQVADTQSNGGPAASSETRGHRIAAESTPSLQYAPQSVVREAPSGRPTMGLAVDSLFAFDGIMCAEGWVFGAEHVTLSAEGAELPPSTIIYLDRADVASAFRLQDEIARGFVAIWVSPPQVTAVTIAAGPASALSFTLSPTFENPQEHARRLIETHKRAAVFILRKALDRPKWVQLALRSLSDAPEHFKNARAFIEEAKALSGIGGMIIGWSICVPPCAVIAVSDDGTARQLNDASRWTRDDINAAFGSEFGTFTFDAGFITTLHAAVDASGPVSLVAVTDAAAYIIARAPWVPAPVDPVSFAKWAFELPTPSFTFGDRLSAHDGPLLECLIRQRNAGLRQLKAEVISFGARNADPICSIVIPVYGRHDFALHQMLEFAEDPFIGSRAEIIFVLDDPRLAETFVRQADDHSRLIGLPLQIAVSGVNRGFSGATNLGARLTTAPHILLLNSDVIPTESGWLETMLAPLTKSESIGAVGARLLYPNGTIQHDGMDFEWEPSLGAFLNKHPGMGYPAASDGPSATTCKAVTGACMLLRRTDFETVGMLDDEFLIGDFEDSDLCLKLREMGREIVLVRDVSLVHLERQSFQLIGGGSFRERVVRYNAWRHQRRWSEKITDLQAFQGSAEF
ncbi:glycosyltransferase family 2 protein [Methylobacterium nigriterrae]|uniref:glycosyltransferase family 2 protein n=1 Tax=Methylobacterium nigriterrae TaxID=3127512 RepID=UPI0030132C24